MAKKRGAKYTAPHFYYNDSYRSPDRDGTLRWMWQHIAAQAEKDECQALVDSKSKENPFQADDGRIPDEPKQAGDPAPATNAAVADPDAGAGADGEDDAAATLRAEEESGVAAVADAATQTKSGDPGLVAPPPSETRVVAPAKRRVLDYMLSMKEMNTELPALDGKLDKAGKRTLLNAGLYDPEEEPNAKRWHGTHFLGQGATGSCTHWVLTDDKENIIRRLAVRDIGTIHQNDWISPIKWRDNLPIEIAILQRLHSQRGYEHHLHRYFGHRIDGWKRRYRVYQEVCEFGNLGDVLQHYSRPWRKRHTQHRWEIAHPSIQQAKDNARGFEQDVVDEDVRETRREVWERYENNRDDPHHKDREFDDLTDLEEGAKEEPSEGLPEVIPEAFLWQVFDQLADAALLLKRGAGPIVGDVEWKEIVHRDLHFGNIFVKPSSEGLYGSERRDDPREPEDGLAKFSKAEYPQVVLADFDTAFFDLQTDEDEYQDNPTHYLCSQSDREIAARYPPETSIAFHIKQGNLTKLINATDVWGIGQIMWNLAMNIPHYTAFEAPFFDHSSEHTGLRPARRLNNGEPYTKTQLVQFLLTGHKPFEASHQYSKLLRTTIRACLQYLPEKRVTVERLKKVTESQRKMFTKTEETTGDLWVKMNGRMEQFRIGERHMPLPEEYDEDT